MITAGHETPEHREIPPERARRAGDDAEPAVSAAPVLPSTDEDASWCSAEDNAERQDPVAFAIILFGLPLLLLIAAAILVTPCN